MNNNATIGYFNFYPANGSTTTNTFDWRTMSAYSSANFTDIPSIPLLQQQINFRTHLDIIQNTTVFGQQSNVGRIFNIRHFNSTHQKIKKPSN